MLSETAIRSRIHTERVDLLVSELQVLLDGFPDDAF